MKSSAVLAGGATRPDTKSTRSALLLVAAAVMTFFWFAFLGGRSLLNPDEGRYATLSLGMLSSGDWITPRLNGILYFEKPAFQYWVGALAYALLGVNEFAARLWPALSGYLTALMVGWTGYRLYGRESGIQALAICAGSTWIIGNSHFLTLDAGLTFFLTVALCALLLAERWHFLGQPQLQRRWMLVAWAAMAGAALSKGLVGLLIPGATLFLASIWRRDFAIWRRMHWVAGIGLFLLLAAPWFVAVSLRNPGFADFFFVHEHFARYLTHVHRREGAWWYYIPFLILGLFPWTSGLPWIGRKTAAEAAGVGPRHVLVTWTLFVLLFFSASGSKLPSYILPAFPALALLIAERLQDANPRKLSWHVLLPAIAWGGAAVFASQAHRFIRDISPELVTPMAHALMQGALLFALCAAMGRWMLRHERVTEAVVAIALGQLVAVTMVVQSHNAFGQLKSAAPIAQRLLPQLRDDTPVFAIRAYDQTLPFYFRRPVTLVQSVDEFAFGLNKEPSLGISSLDVFIQRWNALPQGVAYMERPTWAELTQMGVPMRVVFEDRRRVVVMKP